MSPYFRPMSMKHPATSMNTVTRYSHPQLVVVQLNTEFMTEPMFSGNTMLQRTKAMVIDADTQKINGSKGFSEEFILSKIFAP